MSFTRILGLSLVGGVLGLAACAQGAADADPTGGAPTKNVDKTEPDPPSVKMPDQKPDEDPPPADDDAGGTPATDSGTKTDAGTPTADAGTKVDSGSPVDAGACAKTPPSNACGLAPQCGCAANETCDITNKTTGAVACTLAGGGPLASLCTTSSQCAKGLTCAYGACRPYCATTNTACSGMAGVGMCTDLYDPSLVPNGKVCTITCDLRSPSAVCGSNNCIWDASVKATDCDKAGTKNLYDACSTYNDCKQGMACVNHPAFGPECEKWCRIGQNDCGVFETCQDVYGANAPMAGGMKLGHCQ